MKKQNGIINTIFNPKAIIGIVISVGGIYWAFWDFKFHEFENSIQGVNYLYLLFATLFLWASVWLRALRWRWLFRINTMPTTASLYRAELIGYFGNNILPLRLGELMRAYLIGREWNLSKKYVFGTIVLERILDFLSLIVFAFLLILFYPLEESLREYIIWRGGISLVAIMIFIIILYRIKTIKINHKILNSLKDIIEGLLSINKKAFFPVIAASLFIWGIYYLDVYLLQYAFGFNLSFSQILMILVLPSVALAIPSGPGMIGTFHAAVKYTMVDLFGYAPNDGSSFAIFLHAYGYILLTLLGAYYFMKNQFHNNALQTVLDKD